MSRPYVYYWAPSTVDGFDNGIALIQDKPVGSNLDLVANTPWGIFSYVNINNPLTSNPNISTNVIRSINITSAEDNSGTTFVINGIGTPVNIVDGNPYGLVSSITEELVGPNGGTVTSANIYTVINSIFVRDEPGDTGADQVSVGYGPNGITNYYRVDNNRNVPSIYAMNYQIQMIDNAGLEASVFMSMNNPEIPNTSGNINQFGTVNGQVFSFIPSFKVDGPVTDNLINAIPFTGSVLWAQVTNCTTDAMYFSVVQQGI